MTQGLNIFQAGAAGTNFSAYCAMVNAEVELSVMEREQLYKGLTFTDSEGNEVEGGLNRLSMLQTQTAADAAKESGLNQAAATRAEGIGQIVGGAAGIGTIGITTAKAAHLESQGGTRTTRSKVEEEAQKGTNLQTVSDTPKEKVPATPKEEANKNDKKDPKAESEQKDLDLAKRNDDKIASEAGSWRQNGHTISQSLANLSSGIGSTVAAGDRTAAAYEEEKKALADGLQQQIDRTLQQISAAIQSAEQREQMALQTQAAIVQATSRA